MVDVFISYKREERAYAEKISEVLTTAGFSVWFDAHLGPHIRFGDEIADKLSAAKVVVALWSPGAVKSEWVVGESTKAKDAGKLISCVIERISDAADFGLPVPFNTYSFYDLTSWNGDLKAPEIRPVLSFVLARSKSVAAAARFKELGLDMPAPVPSASVRGAVSSKPKSSRSALVGIVATVGAVLLGLGGGYAYLQFAANEATPGPSIVANPQPQAPTPVAPPEPPRPAVAVAPPPPVVPPSVPVQTLPAPTIVVAAPAIVPVAPVAEPAVQPQVVAAPVVAPAPVVVLPPVPASVPQEPQVAAPPPSPPAPQPTPAPQVARAAPAPEPVFGSDLERVLRRNLPIRSVVTLAPSNDSMAMLEARNFEGLSVSFASSSMNFDRVDCTMATSAARSIQCSWIFLPPGTIRVTATLAGGTRPIILDLRRDGSDVPATVVFGGLRFAGTASQ